MELIDKFAVIAKIEERRDKIKKGIILIPLSGSDRAYATFEYEILGKVIQFIGTFEVNEVTSEFLKKHFEETPQKELDKEWKEIEPLNDIGPDVLEYIDKIKNQIIMENYGKKYKDLEGKIKKAYLYAQTDSTKAVLEDILPELAESEDEKIRKWLIGYTRTDALIEKAEMFFTEKFEVEDYNDNIDIDGSPIFNYGRFIEDFRKYMKGGEK